MRAVVLWSLLASRSARLRVTFLLSLASGCGGTWPGLVDLPDGGPQDPGADANSFSDPAADANASGVDGPAGVALDALADVATFSATAAADEGGSGDSPLDASVTADAAGDWTPADATAVDGSAIDAAAELPVCPAGCCGPPVDGDLVLLADSANGFSAQQGGCGWSFGYLPYAAEPFTPLTIYTTTDYSTPAWEETTIHPPWTVTFATSQHPNEAPLQWNDRRWKSTWSGTVFIRGQVAKTAATVYAGDGIVAHIRVGGGELWSATVAFDDTVGTTFNLTATVDVGTPVDFLVDPRGNDFSDSTTLTALVYR